MGSIKMQKKKEVVSLFLICILNNLRVTTHLRNSSLKLSIITMAYVTFTLVLLYHGLYSILTNLAKMLFSYIKSR